MLSVRLVVVAAQANALLYRSSRRVASRLYSSEAACPVQSTRKWIRDVVVGLNLCPWAGAPLQHGDLRIVESSAEDALACARSEFDSVAATENATVAIAISDACAFEDYLDIVDAVDDAIDAEGHRGAIQLATFHPEYQFGDAAPDAASHWTNRSPFPVLHLLREADVERALESKDGHDVWRRNVAAVEALGAVDMERRVRDCLT
jgi:hypothetical protein